ncbi:porin family protein [Flavobacterium sp. GT3R68]|uniref:porin family protein n=1 Tax=Flavobacterium sp. GT3R68 TaxID=2594437 RepID=UPI000F881378|nr:porin family protein [Flavobacterium sp. GT3R68]RTY95199.1 PorT family protein [Flavobacterium sp. GSN2]TRW91058.1 PorT family protein [Flavobacterium sp. GT3R68]
MKKTIVIVLCSMGFSLSSSAQLSKGSVEFGLNAGYNISTISDNENRAHSGNGLNFAGSADYYFSNRWSIKGKLIYDQKGWDDDYITEFGSGIDYKTNYNVNYLTVPVMANWHFGAKRNWYLNFGPYAGILLGAEDSRFKTDVKKSFETFDIGFAWGAGVKIPISDKAKLFLEYEEQGGFSDVFISNSGSTVRNSRSSFNIGINFLLK